MLFLIFAGGAGTRLWPLSRKNSPKQFSPLHGDKSTVQMAFERIQTFGSDQIFLSTNAAYVPIIREQLPELNPDHIFSEPARRDLAAAVGLSLLRLKKAGKRGTVAILWSDHFMAHPDRFKDALHRAESLVENNPKRFVFFGETPRFANHNLGWIHVGSETASGVREYLGWKYKPEKRLCEKMFASGDWLWNPGYFVFNLDFVLSLYQRFEPDMYQSLERMAEDGSLLEKEYSLLPAKSFDNAIVEHIEEEEAVVLPVDLGWSDPGTLYALKEALAGRDKDNAVRGNVLIEKTEDSLIFNEDSSKLVVGVGLSGMVVVNARDAILVCHKDAVPDITALVKRLEDEGRGDYI